MNCERHIYMRGAPVPLPDDSKTGYSQELDALAAYVNSLARIADGTLTADNAHDGVNIN